MWYLVSKDGELGMFRGPYSRYIHALATARELAEDRRRNTTVSRMAPGLYSYVGPRVDGERVRIQIVNEEYMRSDPTHFGWVLSYQDKSLRDNWTFIKMKGGKTEYVTV